MLRTDELEYDLPAGCVATHPAVPRDSARLLAVGRADGGIQREARVRDLPELLRPGDLLVVNSTRVIPARFVGVRKDTGGKAEGLYLGDGDAAGADSAGASTRVWRVLLRARRLKPGVRLAVTGHDGTPSHVELELVGPLDDGDAAGGGWRVRVCGAEAGAPSVAVLETVGLPPLPPYIRAARREQAQPETVAGDAVAYQTVYADTGREASGSVAAPTAGLHFTPELLTRLEAIGVRRAEVVLHVGTGTFKPVESATVEEHRMHAEWCRVPAATRRAMRAARRAGGRIIAVGTTSARTLESFPALLADAADDADVQAWTRILITPGHAWCNMDGLMTNFHLPRSTLMAMVGALLGADGVARLRGLYAHAIASGYRFYSYGDAMLIT